MPPARVPTPEPMVQITNPQGSWRGNPARDRARRSPPPADPRVRQLNRPTTHRDNPPGTSQRADRSRLAARCRTNCLVEACGNERADQGATMTRNPRLRALAALTTAPDVRGPRREVPRGGAFASGRPERSGLRCGSADLSESCR